MNGTLTRREMVGVLLASSAVGAYGQSWPTQPVKVVIPAGPGTAMDLVTRQLNELLSRSLGQSFLVVNRAGGSGTLGTAVVATSPPDGYTLLTATSTHTSAPTVMPVTYDPIKDFAPIATLTSNPSVFVVSRDSGITTLKQLVDMAKAQPGKLSYSSAGIGSSVSMAIEMFRAAAGFEALHVPFKSTTDALAEIVAGRITFGVTNVAPALQFVSAGRLVALAINDANRVPAMPNLPTLAELGYPSATQLSWVGILAPAKTPRDIVVKLNQEIRKAMATPEMKAYLEKTGTRAYVMSPNEFAAQLHKEVVQNVELVKKLKLKI